MIAAIVGPDLVGTASTTSDRERSGDSATENGGADHLLYLDAPALPKPPVDPLLLLGSRRVNVALLKAPCEIVDYRRVKSGSQYVKLHFDGRSYRRDEWRLLDDKLVPPPNLPKPDQQHDVSPSGIRMTEDPSPGPAQETNGTTKAPEEETGQKTNCAASAEGIDKGTIVPFVPRDLPAPARPPPGMKNLGNTCFVNSVVQCLVTTPLLREYFADAHKISRLAKTEERQLVADFGALVRQMYWLSKVNHDGTGTTAAGSTTISKQEEEIFEKKFLSPTAFKRTLDLVAPYFAGYQQHDAQELLVFLLEFLHAGTDRFRSSSLRAGPRRVYKQKGGGAGTGGALKGVAGVADRSADYSSRKHRRRQRNVVRDIL